MADNPRRNGGPMGPQMSAVEKPKNFGAAMKKLLKLVARQKIAILFVVLLTVVATVFSIISPKILGNMTNQIVDDYISGKVYDTVQNATGNVKLPKDTTLSKLPETLKNMAMSGQLSQEQMQKLSQIQDSKNSNFDNVPSAQKDLIESLDLSQKPTFHYDKLAEIGVFLIILYIISLLANYISGWIASGIIQRSTKKLRSDISKKINRLPIKYFDQHQYGDTLSRVTNDIDTIGQSLTQATSQGISAVFMVIGIVVMMISISWLMALIAFLVLPLSMLFIKFVVGKSQKHFENQQNQLGEINGHIEENYAGQMVVKAFSGEKNAIKHFDIVNKKLYKSVWKSQFLSGLMMPIMHVISNLGYVASAVLGGYLALNGRLSIGDIQAFIQYMGQMNQPVGQLAQIMNLLQSSAAATERVYDFLEEPEQTPDVVNAKQLENVRGAIEISKISFGYEPDKKVIKNFSAKIKPGQKVAIVGPTGAGKTTLVNLLMRFYDVDRGLITIDGVDTSQMSRHDVRKMFGMVLQDTWLMSGTIMENLKYGNLAASDDQVKTAAGAASADHFIRSLADGYQTEIGEDSENVSSGEKQLLTIARAMVADAPMLILDEATSSVDTRTEVLIQKAMDKLMHGRTSFVIAHRLSTIKNADLILVMNEGNIIEQGTHKSLLAKNGFYANLYNSQFAEE